jgi:hypothetical protein
VEDSSAQTAKKTPKKRRSGVQLDTTWHARFLQLFARSLNVQLSCRGAGVGRDVAYIHRKRFPEFAAAWEEARKAAVENLEAEAFARAKRQSDVLLIFLLKSHAPERYREMKSEGAITMATLMRIVEQMGADLVGALNEQGFSTSQSDELLRAVETRWRFIRVDAPGRAGDSRDS